MNKEFYRNLCEITDSENVRLDEPMKFHTTFRIGGKASYFVTPGTKEEIKKIIRLCRDYHIDYFILGNGSNLLVSDNGYDGVIIQIYKNLNRICAEDTVITAMSGAMLGRVAKEAADLSLTGLEFASGIPGTLGGAIVMNAGAYGGEMKDVVTEVTVLDAAGNEKKISGKDMGFRYRTSIIEQKEYIVLDVKMRLQKGEKKKILQRMDELAFQRKSKQPLEYPSAGSTFKRPEGFFAGKLIMDSGLRGYSVGGAMVSEKHCGFVINTGNATAQDVIKLIEDIQNRVYEKFQVRLQTEVKYLGNFNDN